MSGGDAIIIADAFPKDAEGRPLCGHCQKRRKAGLMLCYRCWHQLSAFVQIEILRSPELERAKLIVAARPTVKAATTWIPWTEEMQEYHDLVMHGGQACSCVAGDRG